MDPRGAVVIVATLLAGACSARLREGVRVGTEGVLFRMKDPHATSVSVVGDFNGWSEKMHPMTRVADTWSLVIRLPPGEYLFMYVVDGQRWVTPKNASELAPDGFGGMNGKISVP